MALCVQLLMEVMRIGAAHTSERYLLLKRVQIGSIANTNDVRVGRATLHAGQHPVQDGDSLVEQTTSPALAHIGMNIKPEPLLSMTWV